MRNRSHFLQRFARSIQLQLPFDKICVYECLYVKVLSTSCGWLLNERVLNLPAQLLPPLLDALVQDVCFATTDKVTASVSMLSNAIPTLL
jgi:hypothetical protein